MQIAQTTQYSNIGDLFPLISDVYGCESLGKDALIIGKHDFTKDDSARALLRVIRSEIYSNDESLFAEDMTGECSWLVNLIDLARKEPEPVRAESVKEQAIIDQKNILYQSCSTGQVIYKHTPLADLLCGRYAEHGIKSSSYGSLMPVAAVGSDDWFIQDKLILEFEGWSDEEIKARHREFKKEFETGGDDEKMQITSISNNGVNIKLWTPQELLSTDFPEPEYIVPGIFSTGLNILSGPPKLGKSWLCLDLAYTMSIGGTIFGNEKIKQNRSLYCALEDGPRRLASRLLKQGADINTRDMVAVTEMPDGFLWLHEYMKQFPDTKLIIIDTMQKFLKIQDSNVYEQTVQALSGLKKFADDYGIAVVVVHHNKKAVSDDFVHNLLGSVGISGTADTILSLSRKRGERDAVLSITGRDVTEKELALTFDATHCKWRVLGNTKDMAATRERQEILETLISVKRPLKSSDIAVYVGKSNEAVRRLLYRMVDDGTLIRKGKEYTPSNVTLMENKPFI